MLNMSIYPSRQRRVNLSLWPYSSHQFGTAIQTALNPDG